MRQIVIENPILNSPFEEPRRHFKFTDEGITDEIVAARRVSQYFIPIPRPKKRNPKQLAFETEWTADRVEENKFINQIRERVTTWREGGYVGIAKTTARLERAVCDDILPLRPAEIRQDRGQGHQSLRG